MEWEVHQIEAPGPGYWWMKVLTNVVDSCDVLIPDFSTPWPPSFLTVLFSTLSVP